MIYAIEALNCQKSKSLCICFILFNPVSFFTHFALNAIIFLNAVEQMLLAPSTHAIPTPAIGNSGALLSDNSLAAAEDLPSSETCIIFLVDGSGSVTEQDFACMTDFMLTAAEQVLATAATAAANGTSFAPVRVSIIQFSNEVRVELPPTPLDDNIDQFAATIAEMQRINGGTNIAAAVQKAGQLTKDLSPGCRRVMALLTDGRIDSYQAREAHDMTARLADEQGRVEMHAFGVGRGVDRRELLRIISGAYGKGVTCDSDAAASRYLPLMILDDAPW